jgi:hypothetical protein
MRRMIDIVIPPNLAVQDNPHFQKQNRKKNSIEGYLNLHCFFTYQRAQKNIQADEDNLQQRKTEKVLSKKFVQIKMYRRKTLVNCHT